MTSKTIYIDGVGEILLERSRRAKNISLSVRPFKGVRVAVPFGVSFGTAEKVARAKAGWINRHLRRMSALEARAAEIRQNRPLHPPDAKGRIVKRLDDLCRRHGFTYNRVFVKNQKTRWGSCSGKNNINLNINLVRLPAELMDYVILHELVHTRIRDHSPRFRRELDRLVGDSKKLDRELSRYEILLA
jgi:hypothetical protein